MGTEDVQQLAGFKTKPSHWALNNLMRKNISLSPFGGSLEGHRLVFPLIKTLLFSFKHWIARNEILLGTSINYFALLGFADMQWMSNKCSLKDQSNCQWMRLHATSCCCLSWQHSHIGTLGEDIRIILLGAYTFLNTTSIS